MKVFFAAIVAGIVAVAIVLAGLAGPVLARMAQVLSNL